MAWLYFIVDIVVFMKAEIHLFFPSILVSTDEELFSDPLRSILAKEYHCTKNKVFR